MKHSACMLSGISCRPADRRTRLVGIVMRATAMVRTNSVQSSGSASASGVPGSRTSWLIGTDSGCGSRLARLAISPARSLRVSFIPTMPPQHIFSPAARTLPSVFSRSSNWRVPITSP